ncbi:MAG TPA: zinc-dependent metalloprotease [Thermomicrobiales bacterium]|nr:zinc-dependent metalloprotease [Thermomicrobiales bacterium]
MPAERRSPWLFDKRLLAAGMVAGAALGVWANNRTREYRETGALPKLIDWGQARAVAAGMNRGVALGDAERASLAAEYRRLVERCLDPIAEYTGARLSRPFDAVLAFDRADWVDANIANFAELFEPLETLNPLNDQRPRIVTVLWGNLSQTVLSSEVGLLLGYLARRVLGQYDLALLGKEPLTDGKLYFVEPNIRQVQRMLHLPLDDFRMWLALHETTHVFEFEGHPWLRAHLNAILEQYFEFLTQDVTQLKERGIGGLRTFVERARGPRGEDGANWLELLMTPQQRELFSQMQATMAIVEGYSNHVMNHIGRQLLPDFERISRQFEKRQREKSMAEQIFLRLTGLGMKMEQYRLGEAFIDRVVELRGHDFARQVWDGPEKMPSLDEVKHPERWIARVDALAPAAR